MKKNKKLSYWNPGLIHFFLTPNFLTQKTLFESISKYKNFIGGKILDFGCGQKPYVDLFDFTEYIGLELNDQSYSRADLFYDGKEIPFKEKEFDSVVSFQVLYQCDDIDFCLNQIKRVLKDNGSLLISLPFMWFDGGDNPERRFSAYEIKNLLNRNGFKILNQSLTCNNLSSTFVLINSFINTEITNKIPLRIIRIFLRLIICTFLNTLSLISYKITPRTSNIYLNRIILAKKI